MQWYVRGPLDLEKAMAKEKSDGDKFSAIGEQTIARSYSAMDYYFDHLKKCVASAPSGGTERGEKVKACAEQNISATQEFVRDPNASINLTSAANPIALSRATLTTS